MEGRWSHRCQAISKSSPTNSVKFPDLRLIWGLQLQSVNVRLCPLGSWLPPQSPLSFRRKGRGVCSSGASSACSLTRVLGVHQPSFSFLLAIPSVPWGRLWASMPPSRTLWVSHVCHGNSFGQTRGS